MTRKEQIKFVKDLMASVEGDVVRAIHAKEIPDTWDGIELREYLYEKALRFRANQYLTGTRGRAYRNVLTTSNL